MVPHAYGIEIPKENTVRDFQGRPAKCTYLLANSPYYSHSTVRPLCVAVEGS